MTPNDIEILLHFYTTPEPHERMDALAVKEAIESFLERKILVYDNGDARFHVTGKGEKLVHMLCETPDPIQRWLDPRLLKP